MSFANMSGTSTGYEPNEKTQLLNELRTKQNELQNIKILDANVAATGAYRSQVIEAFKAVKASHMLIIKYWRPVPLKELVSTLTQLGNHGADMALFQEWSEIATQTRDTENKTLTMPATPGYTSLSKSYTPSSTLEGSQIQNLSQALLSASIKNGTAADIYSSHDIHGSMGSTLRPIEDSPN